jgi:uracil phosphoribosyltransferase
VSSGPGGVGSSVVLLEHPLAAIWLTVLRDEQTRPAAFRSAVRRLAGALAWEATRDLAVEPLAVRTPITETVGVRRAAPQPLLVPVLRAGVWMVDAFLELIEDAEVGMIGMARDEETLRPTTYVDRLPAVVADDRPVFVLDPMLATGGSACAVAAALEARGVRSATILSVLAAPEGLARVRAQFPTWRVVTAAIDDHLDERGFIVPGLGDAGDRLSG